jgi:hypothetical protein
MNAFEISTSASLLPNCAIQLEPIIVLLFLKLPYSLLPFQEMATNITWHQGHVSKEERETFLGQKVSKRQRVHKGLTCQVCNIANSFHSCFHRVSQSGLPVFQPLANPLLPLLLSKPFFTPKSQAIVLMVITFALV